MDETVKRVNAVFCRGDISPGYLRLNFLEMFLTQVADLRMSWFAVARRSAWVSPFAHNKTGWLGRLDGLRSTSEITSRRA